MGLFEVGLGALAIFLATSLGSVAAFAINRINKIPYSAMIAFSAGIMAFSALEMLTQSHKSSGDFAVIVGLTLGTAVLFASDRLLPHIHSHIRKSELMASKKKATLLAGALTIHNVPEGFSVASAFASSVPLGWLLTASIALQDIPEGLLVSAPLARYGVSMKRSIGFGVLSGLVEAGAAIAGYVLLRFVSAAIPLALSFSAGAMLYVILAELLPDAFRNGLERTAAVSFLAGFIIAFVLAGLLSF